VDYSSSSRLSTDKKMCYNERTLKYMSMNQSTKSIFIWGAVVLGIIALVWLLASLGSDGGAATQSLGDGVSATDHVTGASNPTVTLVEYSDFQCPACSAAYPMVKQLSQDFPCCCLPPLSTPKSSRQCTARSTISRSSKSSE